MRSHQQGWKESGDHDDGHDEMQHHQRDAAGAIREVRRSEPRHRERGRAAERPPELRPPTVALEEPYHHPAGQGSNRCRDGDVDRTNVSVTDRDDQVDAQQAKNRPGCDCGDGREYDGAEAALSATCHVRRFANSAAVDIRQLADAGEDGVGQRGPVEIRICLDQAEPPAGRVHQVVGPEQQERETVAIPFSGWLGLLRALDEAFRRQP